MSIYFYESVEGHDTRSERSALGGNETEGRETMTEENKNQVLPSEHEGKGDAKKFLPWLVHFLLTAVVILAVGVFFQTQIVSLQEELSSLKTKLGEEEKARSLRKRSSTERGGEGIQAAYFQGTLPFQYIEEQGRIGPWSASSTDDGFVSLRKTNTEVELNQTGIYYVYAQVYYLTSEPHNSFQILSYNGTEERRRHRNLATCSSQGRNSMGEASCYTGFTGGFNSGDRIYLNQIEQNRIVHFTNGCTYFGVVLLRKNALLKRTP